MTNRQVSIKEIYYVYNQLNNKNMNQEQSLENKEGSFENTAEKLQQQLLEAKQTQKAMQGAEYYAALAGDQDKFNQYYRKRENAQMQEATLKKGTSKEAEQPALDQMIETSQSRLRSSENPSNMATNMQMMREKLNSGSGLEQARIHGIAGRNISSVEDLSRVIINKYTDTIDAYLEQGHYQLQLDDLEMGLGVAMAALESGDAKTAGMLVGMYEQAMGQVPQHLESLMSNARLQHPEVGGKFADYVNQTKQIKDGMLGRLNASIAKMKQKLNVK